MTGKVAYTASQFVCVPGTATPEFHAAFCAAYAPHYDDIIIMGDGPKKKGAKFGLDPAKPDPLALRARTAVIDVPVGLTCRIVQTGASAGWLVPDLAPVPDPHHRAPALTPLGQRLLGLAEW